MCSIQMMEMPSRVEVLDRLDEDLDLGLGEPAGDLVQEQDGGVAGERARELEPLAVEQRQRAGLLVGLGREPRELQRLHAALVARALGQVATVSGAHEHVLEHAHVAERLGDLERAADPLAAAIVTREPVMSLP